MTHPSLACIDHLVYASPDLQQGIDHIEALTGVKAVNGGAHPQWGTANALLSLGAAVYLEIIGPDPAQPGYTGERVFRIDEINQPTLVTWAARRSGLEQLSGQLLPNGARVGMAFPASRQRPDGQRLEWILTDPREMVADGLLPFFIDWLGSPHPAADAPAGVTLTDFTLEHPDPIELQLLLNHLELELPISAGESPALVATLSTPMGFVELR